MIRILEQNLINQIAAGEVIERPASALKELIENALDAGATQIDIALNEGGKTLLSVRDNGSGMEPSQLTLAVQRHATSKLPTGDLFNIHTFGFRGEALPSIGAVSRLEITSRNQTEDMGMCLRVEGGEHHDLMPVKHHVGTTIMMRDLFFATPARLKFLKTNNTEFNHCQTLLKYIMMANFHVGFSLLHNDRNIFSHAATKDLGQRLAQILGQDFFENMHEIQADHDEHLSLTGYMSVPTFNRSTSGDQYFFVNNRFVKDRAIQNAIRLAYQDVLPHGRYAVCVLFLKIAPHDVDVNAHPAKTEVRFRDPTSVYNFVRRALKQSLHTISQNTSNHLQDAAMAMFHENANRTSSASPVDFIASSGAEFGEKSRPQYSHSNSANFGSPFGSSGGNTRYEQASPLMKNHQGNLAFHQTPPQQTGLTHASFESTADPQNNGDGNSFAHIPNDAPNYGMNGGDDIAAEAKEYPLGNARAQIDHTYIIAEKSDAMIIVDQHAAHERLVYEKLKRLFYDKRIAAQTLLIPEIVSLGAEDLAILDKFSDQLQSLGFRIEIFGGESCVVREVPTILTKANVSKLLHDVVSDLKEYEDVPTLIENIHHVMATMACHNSIRAGRALNMHEMNALLRQMEENQMSGQCNHGRPTYIQLNLNQIEKLFERV